MQLLPELETGPCYPEQTAACRVRLPPSFLFPHLKSVCLSIFARSSLLTPLSWKRPSHHWVNDLTNREHNLLALWMETVQTAGREWRQLAQEGAQRLEDPNPTRAEARRGGQRPWGTGPACPGEEQQRGLFCWDRYCGCVTLHRPQENSPDSCQGHGVPNLCPAFHP